MTFNFFVVLGIVRLLCASTLEAVKSPSPTAYPHNTYVSETLWDRVTPYFLPENHPIKEFLDRLFSTSRVILSLESMKKAGFLGLKPRKWTHLIVTKHPKVPGYVFKIYLDAQRYHKSKPEYDHWLERIRGVTCIRNEINKHHWDHLFKAPKKWIYPLPAEPSPPKEFLRKNFILVEEDMDVLDQKANEEKWRSRFVTKEILDALYTILEKYGLHDCPKPANLPFSKDGRISFVDTQPVGEWPVSYYKLDPFLSPSLKAYWKNLTKKARKNEKLTKSGRQA